MIVVLPDDSTVTNCGIFFDSTDRGGPGWLQWGGEVTSGIRTYYKVRFNRAYYMNGIMTFDFEGDQSISHYDDVTRPISGLPSNYPARL